MFTIKLVHQSGNTEVLACDSYSKTPRAGSKLPTVTLIQRGGEEQLLRLADGDIVYVENQAGRTIDVVRTGAKAVAAAGT